MHMAYGIEVQDHDDPYVHAAEEVADATNAAAEFRGAVFNLVPFCEASMQFPA